MDKIKKAYKYKIKCEKDKSFALSIKVKASNDVEKFVKENLYNDDLNIYESMYMLMLDNQMNIKGYSQIAQGGITNVMIDERIIYKYAVDVLCTGVILVHNHPSGSIEFSEQDKQLTEKVKRGLNLLNIKLLDHIVVTEESYISANDKGLIYI